MNRRSLRPGLPPGRRLPGVLPLALVGIVWLTLTAGSAVAQEGGHELDRAAVDSLVRFHAFSAIERYRELLSLPNDAHRPEDVLDLVAWLEEAFSSRGFRVERLPTGGLPVLLAERRHPGAERTVLVYLQADGQPVEPSAWDQESPWVPVLKEPLHGGVWRAIPWSRLRQELDPDWRVFARSAADSKGPIAQLLAALTLAGEVGVEPDFHLKILVDTEEEMGSPHLAAAVERYGDRLAADMLVIFDGPPHASGAPTLKFGARGIATATLTVYGPRVPQHSGHYGNYVPNPAHRLAELLASFRDRQGRVVIPGWYDGISIDPDTREVLGAVPDDEEAIRRQLGIATIDSVATSLQGAVQYPSLNVRGMRAGWVGDAARTIIPDTAVAELDIRLVLESDPEALLSSLREHIRRQGYLLLDRAPTDPERAEHSRIASLTSRVAYGAFRTPFDSEPGRWLRRAFLHRYGGDPILIRTSGGSIPISPFVRTLDVPAVSVPTVNPDNNQHSPNENLRLGDFLRGIGTMLVILDTPVLRGDPDVP